MKTHWIADAGQGPKGLKPACGAKHKGTGRPALSTPLARYVTCRKCKALVQDGLRAAIAAGTIPAPESSSGMASLDEAPTPGHLAD